MIRALLAAAVLGGPIVDVPVEFGVVNTNTSGVPCPSDGAAYTVRGRLVGPRSALAGPRPRAVTLYLHGFNAGGFMWRPPGEPRLDHAMRLARLGHVSVVVDTIGYDSSDHPVGFQTCLGSQADVTHQIVGDLRARGFDKVVVAGHDSGATVAAIEAYSYQDADALIHLTWADQGFTDTALTGFARLMATCARGGDPAEQGPPARSDPAGGPGGYAFFLDDAKVRSEQRNTEPRVIDRLMLLWNRNPCGMFASISAAVRINLRRNAEIAMPVLNGYGEHEFLWTQDALAAQADTYSGSADVTNVVFREAGHFPMFARVARGFQTTVAEWLRTRGFVSAGARTAKGCPARWSRRRCRRATRVSRRSRPPARRPGSATRRP
jgi:pimeloyl-ACP methyl ester carboxylesterase